MSTRKNYRWDEATSRTLSYLTSKDFTETDLIKAALQLYSERYTSVAHRLARVRKALMDEIQGLQYVRDDRELTPDETALLDWLNRVDDESELLPGFWEPRYLEREDGSDYLRDAKGELILDVEHEKTRPEDL